MIKKIFIPLFLFIFISYNPIQAQQGFIGEVKLFGGNFAPRGWAFCEGQLLPISENTALFSILGTTYGGDGRTTFALPDLRGRTAIGAGNGAGLTSIRDGEKVGAEEVVLNTNNLPDQYEAPSVQLDPKKKGNEYSPGNKSFISVGNAPNTTVKTPAAGQGQKVNNRSPYTGVHYIICIQGTFPSRS